MSIDDRWRRRFRCAPESPRKEPRIDTLIRLPLGLYVVDGGPQDQGDDDA